jgi:hypothetical protein
MTRIQDGKNSYEVIGITELYPKYCRYLPGKAELQIEGYELFLLESTSFSKRGAALYINKKLKSEEIKFNVKFEESVWAQIRLNSNIWDKVLLSQSLHNYFFHPVFLSSIHSACLANCLHLYKITVCH